MKKAHVAYIDLELFQAWKAKSGNLGFSEWARQHMAAEVHGVGIVIKAKESELQMAKERIENGKMVSEAVKKIDHELKEGQNNALQQGDEARKEIRHWHEMHIKAINGGPRWLQTQADKLKKEICEKYNLGLADIVAIAEGKPLRDEDEQPGQ